MADKIITLTPQSITETYTFKNQKTSSLNGKIYARNMGLPTLKLDIQYAFNSVKSYSQDLPTLIKSLSSTDRLLIPLHQHIAENGIFRVFSSLDPSLFLIDGVVVSNPTKTITGDTFTLDGVSPNSQQFILLPVSKVGDSFSNINLKTKSIGTASYSFVPLAYIKEAATATSIEDFNFTLNFVNDTYDTTKVFGNSFEGIDKRQELMLGKTRTQSIEVFLRSRDEIAAFIRFIYRNRLTQEFRIRERTTQAYKKCIFLDNNITITYTTNSLAKVNTTVIFTEDT